MEKTKKLTTKKVILLVVALFLVSGCALGGIALAKNSVKRVSTDEEYSYINPDETKAETDEGFKIDGVLDEQEYQKNNWLYLHHKDDEKKVDVDIAMTSYYGDKGMYFVYDVTDRKTVYVNLDRKSIFNTCVEMYLAPNYVMERNSHMFEIDLLPTGDMVFKKINGKGGYVDVKTTNDVMAYLGATTKGGEVNTPECTGFNLELFIPWDYLETFGINTDEMKESYAYVSPAYITSYNHDGVDASNDRYWYNFGSQHGVNGTTPVFQYFRFDTQGVRGTVPTKVVTEENCTVTGAATLIPGMKTTYTITPDAGYAVNSVLVNGKEYIQKLDYNEDGTAMLTIRGKTEGLEIKAAAEAVKDGNKTLSGVLTVDEGGFDGVTIKYKTKNGLKDLPIDAQGRFKLENMPQGYYLIKAQKEGYESLERGIYLNRDMNIELFLQYIEFIPENSNSWILDGEDEGVLQRFGGRGIIRTKKSYNKFTAEINLKYDTEVSTEYEHDYFTQQRQGARITFSNGKEWNLHLVRINGVHTLHYIPFAGKNAVFPKSESVYLLSEQEVAKYTGKEGITLKIVRDGKHVNLWLDNKLVAVEILDEEYSKCTAQVGFEAWAATRVVKDYKYSITSDAKNVVKHSLFRTAAGWDVAGQYDGYISMPKGGYGKIQFTSKYTAMDLTIKARDYADASKTNARYDVLFLFNVNGAEKHVSVGFRRGENGVTITAQNKDGENDGNQIYTKWKPWGKMTEEEEEQYLGDGIDFRLVRYGTELLIYIGDRFVNVVDLTNNNSGVTANTEATVLIRHYDDAGTEVVIPFEMKTELEAPITITSVESKYGKVVGQRKTYFVGDTVTLVGDEKDGYYCKTMKVNGKDVQLNLDGTYTFTATEKNYTVEGTYGKRTFQNNGEWNSFAQDEGVVTLPNGGGSSSGALKTAKKYGNVAFKVTTREYAEGAKKGRTDIGLVFENGSNVSFSIIEKDSLAWVESWNYASNLGGKLAIYPNSHDWGNLTAAEKAAYDSDTGVEFRVVRYGTDAYIYIGERLLAVADLTANNSGVTADMKVELRLRHFDDSGVEIEMPFELTTELPPLGTIESVESAHGKVVGTNNTYFVGDTIILAGDAEDGYYCKTMKVNGEEVEMNLDGTYALKTTEKHYKVEGTYAESIFKNNSKWNISAQGQGVVSIPAGTDVKDTWLQLSKEYQNIDITVKARDNQSDVTLARTDIFFVFDVNGTKKNLSIGIINNGTYYRINADTNADSTKYGTPIYNQYSMWGNGSLIDGEIDQYNGAGVDLRLVRVGEVIRIYVGERLVDIADLTNNNSGVTADTKATVYIRQTNDTKVERVIPFTISETVGDTFSGEIAYTHNTVGTTTKYSKKIANPVTDIDLTLICKRMPTGNTNDKFDVVFDFANGEQFHIRLGNYSGGWPVHEIGKDGKETGTIWYTLTGDESTALRTATLDFRVVRKDTNVFVSIGNKYVATIPLTNVAADTTAKVTIEHYGKATDTVKTGSIPFTMSTTVDTVGNIAYTHNTVGSLTKDSKVIANAVTDIDLTLICKRMPTGNTSDKFDVVFNFANGEKLDIRLGNYSGWTVHEIDKSGRETGTIWYTLTGDETTALRTATLDFRVVRKDTNVLIYVGTDAEPKATIALTNVTANETATVTIEHFGKATDTVKTASIPFVMSENVEIPQVAPTSLLKSNFILRAIKKLAM